MKVLLYGATGMVGQGVLRECLLDPGVTAVIAVGRTATGLTHPKLKDLVLPDLAARTRLLQAVQDQGVGATFHYVPLHSSAAGRRVGSAPLGCPVTDDMSDRLLRLPLYSDITPADYERVADVVATELARLPV